MLKLGDLNLKVFIWLYTDGLPPFYNGVIFRPEQACLYLKIVRNFTEALQH